MPTVPERKTTKAYGRMYSPVPSQGVEPSQVPAKMEKIANDIYERQVKRVNDIAILEADTAIADNDTDLLHNKDTGALNRFGSDAIGSYSDVQTQRTEFMNNIINGLSNDAQKDAVRARSAHTGSIFNQKLQVHQAKQTLLHENNTYQAAFASKKNALENDYADASERSRTFDEVDQLIVRNGQTNGLGSKEIKAMKERTKSDLHKLVVKQYLLRGDHKGAREYYDKHGKEMYEDENLQKQVVESYSDGEASKAVADIVSEMGPQVGDDNAAFELDVMNTELNKRLKGDPAALKVARVLLKERKIVRDASITERAEENEGILWDAEAQGATIAGLLVSEEYMNLPGKVKSKFKSALLKQSAESKDALRAEQEINFDTLSSDLPLLRETDITAMVRRKELSTLGYRSLNRLLDPQKQPSAMSAFDRLKVAKKGNVFDMYNADNNAKIYGEYQGMLHSFLENNPEGDVVEFVDKIMEPIDRTNKEWLRDLWLGTPGSDDAIERKSQHLKSLVKKKEVEPKATEAPIKERRKVNPSKDEAKRQRAVDWLKVKKQKVTDANIKYVMERF